MNKLDLLKLAELQDSEAFYEQDFEETESEKYSDFYDDVKQPKNYIKEDWWLWSAIFVQGTVK